MKRALIWILSFCASILISVLFVKIPFLCLPIADEEARGIMMLFIYMIWGCPSYQDQRQWHRMRHTRRLATLSRQQDGGRPEDPAAFAEEHDWQRGGQRIVVSGAGRFYEREPIRIGAAADERQGV